MSHVGLDDHKREPIALSMIRSRKLSTTYFLRTRRASQKAALVVSCSQFDIKAGINLKVINFHHEQTVHKN